jgi:hypothetical protein
METIREAKQDNGVAIASRKTPEPVLRVFSDGGPTDRKPP